MVLHDGFKHTAVGKSLCSMFITFYKERHVIYTIHGILPLNVCLNEGVTESTLHIPFSQKGHAFQLDIKLSAFST